MEKVQTLDDKIKAAEGHKETGRNFFKEQKFKEAMKEYHMIVLYLKNQQNKQATSMDTSFTPSENQVSSVVSLLAAAYFNLAMCHLKEKRYEKVANYCNEALAVDSNHTKALYNRGSAYSELGRLDEAQEDLNNALKVMPEDKAVLSALKRLEARYKQQDKKDAKTYQKMFRPNPSEAN